MRFKNKVVIVTEGSSGIGRACVGLRWHEGAFVHNLDLIRPALKANKNGEQEFWMEADLGDEKVPDRAIHQVLSSRGRIDVLINNAAFTAHREGALLQTDRNEWQKQFDITATGAFSMSQAYLPPMIDQQGGTMVNMGSIGELSPFASFLASSDSSYIFGATLVVDGGWSITQWSDRLGPRGRCRGTSIRQLEPCVRGKRNNLRMKTQ